MDSHIADLSGFSPKVTKRTKVHPGCLRFSSDDDSKSKYKNGLSLSIQSILYHEKRNTCLPKINLSYTKPLVENSTINYSIINNTFRKSFNHSSTQSGKTFKTLTLLELKNIG